MASRTIARIRKGRSSSKKRLYQGRFFERLLFGAWKKENSDLDPRLRDDGGRSSEAAVTTWSVLRSGSSGSTLTGTPIILASCRRSRSLSVLNRVCVGSTALTFADRIAGGLRVSVRLGVGALLRSGFVCFNFFRFPGPNAVMSSSNNRCGWSSCAVP